MANFLGFRQFQRSFSTTARLLQQQTPGSSAGSSSMIHPPMQVFGIEGRYAAALFSAASKQKQLDQVDQDFQKLDKIVKSDHALKDLFRNPILTREQRLVMISELSKIEKLSEITKSTLELLIENHRQKKLSTFIRMMNRLMASHRGELTCRVITAKPMDDKIKQELDSVLKQFAKKGEKLNVETHVDPAIMGGMIVEVGDRYIDMSIASKIKAYTEILTTNA